MDVIEKIILANQIKMRHIHYNIIQTNTNIFFQNQFKHFGSFFDPSLQKIFASKSQNYYYIYILKDSEANFFIKPETGH